MTLQESSEASPMRRSAQTDELSLLRVSETVLRDCQIKMFLHFVIADHLAHSDADLILAMQRLALRLRGRDEFVEILLRRLEHFFTLASPFVGWQRIPAHDQSFAREIVFVIDLRQIHFVQQRTAEFARIDKRPKAIRTQARI